MRASDTGAARARRRQQGARRRPTARRCARRRSPRPRARSRDATRTAGSPASPIARRARRPAASALDVESPRAFADRDRRARQLKDRNRALRERDAIESLVRRLGRRALALRQSRASFSIIEASTARASCNLPDRSSRNLSLCAPSGRSTKTRPNQNARRPSPTIHHQRYVAALCPLLGSTCIAPS